MELIEASTTGMGLIFAKRLAPLSLRPETLVSPYDKILKDIHASGKIDLTALALKYGPTIINSALEAEHRLNGLGELADWPRIIEESAALYTAGVQLEKMGRKLQGGENIKWEEVQMLSRNAQAKLSQDLVPMSEIKAGEMPFIKTGWKIFDEHFGGVPQIGLVVVGGRPGVGKTWFMTKIVSSYAKENKDKNLAVFSLEMVDFEIVARFKGDGILEANRPSEINQKRMFVCDKPKTADEIIQTCTTVPNLGLVCIDFSDLLIRSEANETQMAILYKTLMLGAKELGCTIVLLSQLSRKNGIPKPSDLRYCLPETERVFNAETGAWQSPKDFESKVLSIDFECGSISKNNAVGFENKEQEILMVTSASGFELNCSKNHPLLTENGWKNAEDLLVGDLIAVFKTAKPNNTVSYSYEKAKMLGYMLGDGYMPDRSEGGIAWSEPDQELIDDFRVCFEKEFKDSKFHVTRHATKNCNIITFPKTSPSCKIAEFALWLESLGVRGMNSYTFRIPKEVFTWDDKSVAGIIEGLIASDGTVNSVGIKYSSVSSGLLLDIKLLLMRFSVSCRISKTDLCIKSLPDLIHLSDKTNIPGKKGRLLKELIERKKNQNIVNDSSDVLPIQFTYISRKFKTKLTKTRRITRNRFKQLSKIYEMSLDKKSEALISDEIWWDKIKSIKPNGTAMTYDISVEKTENFLVGGFVTHNTGLAEALSWMILMLYDPATDWTAEDKDKELPVVDGSAYIIGWKIRGGFKMHPNDFPGAICVPFKPNFGWHGTKGKWFTLKKFER